ncbi:DinB family protein [Paenibacillus endoradicis]|uniref:DinB family protein n=1 Tax=Paenibacillus endoradicis TaxID=2972487 RepID=UPI0021599788|nr:DinB family protein [Paenibacillus endoradicis]MCR8656550.1 DinB family protein [Paenibacillus endoradicis]
MIGKSYHLYNILSGYHETATEVDKGGFNLKENIVWNEDFIAKEKLTKEERLIIISEIPQIINSIRKLVNPLTESQLEYTYRESGWTIRQVINHLVDNDINAYFRFKRGLTESDPMVSSYREDLFAELIDYQIVPINRSLLFLEMLHQRFSYLLTHLEPIQYDKTISTEVLGSITLDIAIQRFVWHNVHHIKQIDKAIQKNIFNTESSTYKKQ